MSRQWIQRMTRVRGLLSYSLVTAVFLMLALSLWGVMTYYWSFVMRPRTFQSCT